VNDRLAYAAIGLVLGSLLSIVLWWLYGVAMSPLLSSASPEPRLLPWLICIGGGCAIAGFIFKERVGDLVGSAFRAVYEVENLEGRVPAWLVVLALVGVVAAVGYFLAN
jgi:hypothetical protein